MRKRANDYREPKGLEQPYSKKFESKEQAERFIFGLKSHSMSYKDYYIHENPLDKTVWLYINGLKKS